MLNVKKIIIKYITLLSFYTIVKYDKKNLSLSSVLSKQEICINDDVA